MKIYPFSHFKLRNFAPLLGIAGATLALFLSSGQTPSWAAPEQNPQQQTVPPRPTPTPTLLLPTVEPAPTTASTRLPQDDDDQEEDEKGEEPRPRQTPGAESEKPDNAETIPEALTEGEEPNRDEPPSSGTSNQDTSRQGQDEPSSTESLEAADNLESIPEIVPADLSLRKMVSPPSLMVGSIVTLTTVISNNGPGLATNVVIRDPLPGIEMELLETTISDQGSYKAETGTWQIETIAHNQSITMNLVAKVLEAGTVNSSAAVILVDQPDPDSIPGNDLESEDDQGSASVVAMMSNETSSVQVDDASLTSASTSVSTSESVTISSGVDVLYWLYGLIVGTVFIVIGVFLVRRS